jgi:hypothetical protein
MIGTSHGGAMTDISAAARTSARAHVTYGSEASAAGVFEPNPAGSLSIWHVTDSGPTPPPLGQDRQPSTSIRRPLREQNTRRVRNRHALASITSRTRMRRTTSLTSSTVDTRGYARRAPSPCRPTQATSTGARLCSKNPGHALHSHEPWRLTPYPRPLPPRERVQG